MPYEVEQKFAVTDEDSLLAKFGVMGAEFGEPIEQIDTYFAPPDRDFAKTDEALRVRSADGRICFTYKGPKVDQKTKTRLEIEIPLAVDDLGQPREFLEALGFRPVLDVRKIRRRAGLVWEGNEIEASLDQVDGLGLFLELEMPATADDALDDARAAIASLAEHLELTASERRSYLEMLLAK